MKYLIVLLLISGCAANPISAPQTYSHNLSGSWSDGKAWNISQNGDSILGSTGWLNGSPYMPDSSTAIGVIENDSVFIMERDYQYGAATLHKIRAQINKNDTQLDGVWTGQFLGGTELQWHCTREK